MYVFEPGKVAYTCAPTLKRQRLETYLKFNAMEYINPRIPRIGISPGMSTGMPDILRRQSCYHS